MDRKMLLGVSGFGVALIVGSQMAMADVSLAPQSFMAGGFAVMPSVELKTVYDNNIYNTQKDAAASFYEVVNPTVRFVKQDRLNNFNLTYSLKGGMYANDSNDSYNDHLFGGDVHLEPNDRFRFDGGLKYGLLHDDRGTGATAGLVYSAIEQYGEVDKYNQFDGNAGVEYGAEDALGLFVVNAKLTQKRYDRALVAKIRDSDVVQSSAGLRFKLTEKTSVVADYERLDATYTGKVTPDSVDNRLLAGVSWKNSIQTSGKVRFGTAKRDQSHRTVTKPTWSGEMIWSPQESDSVYLTVDQRLKDSDALFSMQGRTIGAFWKHDWAERLSSRLSYTNLNDDYTSGRLDKTNTYGLGADYQLRRWFVVKSDISSQKRDSNRPGFSLDQQVYSVGIQLSL